MLLLEGKGRQAHYIRHTTRLFESITDSLFFLLLLVGLERKEPLFSFRSSLSHRHRRTNHSNMKLSSQPELRRSGVASREERIGEERRRNNTGASRLYFFLSFSLVQQQQQHAATATSSMICCHDAACPDPGRRFTTDSDAPASLLSTLLMLMPKSAFLCEPRVLLLLPPSSAAAAATTTTTTTTTTGAYINISKNYIRSTLPACLTHTDCSVWNDVRTLSSFRL